MTQPVENCCYTKNGLFACDSREVYGAVMSDDGSLDGLCEQHYREATKMRERKEREGDCDRCKANPGTRLYPVGDAGKMICDSCWTALRGRPHVPVRGKSPYDPSVTGKPAKVRR